MTPTQTRITILGLIAAVGTAAPAQDAAPRNASPQAVEEIDTIERSERVMPRRRPEADPVTPAVEPQVRAPTPGLTGGHAWSDTDHASDPLIATRLPEGTTLIRRPGRVFTLPTGHRVFLTDEDARYVGEGPMLIFPSRTLARLDASVAGAPSAPVVLSGYVYEYGERNYILPTAFSRDSLPPIAETPAQTPATDTADDSAQPASDRDNDAQIASAFDDPDIASLLSEIDSSPSVRAIAPPVPQQSQSSGGQSSVISNADSFVADGTPITRRRARLVRGPGGAWAFRFDNDFDTSSSAAGSALDLPLTVLPCRLLHSLERLAMSRGEGIELLVSGRIYTYGQRSYILPTLYQRPLKLGLDPIQ